MSYEYKITVTNGTPDTVESQRVMHTAILRNNVPVDIKWNKEDQALKLFFKKMLANFFLKPKRWNLTSKKSPKYQGTWLSQEGNHAIHSLQKLWRLQWITN